MNNHNKPFIAVALIVFVGLYSCDSNDDSSLKLSVIKPPKCKVTEISFSSPGITGTSTITYNASGYPTSLVQQETDSTGTNGFRDEYLYDGDQVVQIVERDLDGNLLTVVDLRWEGDKIELLSFEYEDSIFTIQAENRYEFNGDNVTKIVNWASVDGSPFFQVGFDTFQWTDKNVTKQESFLDDAFISGRMIKFTKQDFKPLARARVLVDQLVGTNTYVYNDQNNPFQFWGYLFGDGAILGANNLVNSSESIIEDGLVIENKESFRYDNYNSDGFPTQQTSNPGAPEEEVSNFTYNCN